MKCSVRADAFEVKNEGSCALSVQLLSVTRIPGQHTSPQQFETSAAIHLSFERFQTIHLSFQWAVIPTRRDCHAHHFDISTKCFCKLADEQKFASNQLVDPSRQLVYLLPSQHASKLQNQLAKSMRLWTEPQKWFHMADLSAREHSWRLHEQAGNSSRRKMPSRL